MAASFRRHQMWRKEKINLLLQQVNCTIFFAPSCCSTNIRHGKSFQKGMSSTASTASNGAALIWTPPPSEEGDQKSDSHKVELKFSIDINTQSEPLEGGTRNDVIDYFIQQTTRDCFLSCGGKKKIDKYPITSELQDIWKESCRYFQSNNFAEDDDYDVMSCQVEVWFPGVHLCNTILSGIQLVYDGDGIPVYEMCTLVEKHETQGMLAWLFDRLTGNADIPKGQFYRSGMHAVSRLTIVEQQEQFSISGSIQVDVKIVCPAILLRLSPFSKSKIEELAHNSCEKEISKDLRRALEKTCDKYQQYLQSKKAETDEGRKKAARIRPIRAQSLYRNSFPIGVQSL